MSLVDQVKRKLNVTWSDEGTDGRIADIMSSADASLRFKLGITNEKFDFGKAGLENTLFLALALYMFNHAENEFDVNYANEIAQCRAIHEVLYYQQHETEDDADDTTS